MRLSVQMGARQMGGNACEDWQCNIDVGSWTNLLTPVRSHEDHGTKLTNVVSKINGLTTWDSCGQRAEGGCWWKVAAERAEGAVLIGKGCSGSRNYWGSALSLTCMWQLGVLEMGECQWLPGAKWHHWDLSMFLHRIVHGPPKWTWIGYSSDLICRPLLMVIT